MSKQLSVSAFASVAAMALFALTAGIEEHIPRHGQAAPASFIPTALVD